VARVRGRVSDMWANAPGGWVYEWGLEAERVERRDPLLAATLWGAARFPVACDESRRDAHRRQIACYLEAAPHFPVPFERKVVAGVPAHLFTPRGGESRPLVLLSGGADTFKVELHRLALGLARAGLRVAAIDMPGTGESPGPLTPDAHLTYLSVLDALAPAQRRGVLGISFGGHWAAKLALLGHVDAAVDVGGPVGALALNEDFVRGLPNGMPWALAHALGRSDLPDEHALGALIEAFSLRHQGLLHDRLDVPLLVVNGDRDPYVPLADTTVFRHFEHSEVIVLRDAWHCAGDRFIRVAPFLIAWLSSHLTDAFGARALLALTRKLLPPSR